MKMLSIKKSKFSKINNKRCHFPNVILYLPFRHLLLNKTREMKTKYIKKIHNHIAESKEDLLREKCHALSKCERLCLLNSTFE